MAKPTDPGQRFLEALTQYVDFRLTEQGPPNPVPPNLERFVGLFELFLQSRGGKPERDAYKWLAAHMSNMKETGGPGGRKPEA